VSDLFDRDENVALFYEEPEENEEFDEYDIAWNYIEEGKPFTGTINGITGLFVRLGGGNDAIVDLNVFEHLWRKETFPQLGVEDLEYCEVLVLIDPPIPDEEEEEEEALAEELTEEQKDVILEQISDLREELDRLEEKLYD
jgi:hypothetical protein